MTKSTVRIEALEKRVEEILAWVNEKPTREELTRELESVYLIVEQRDKRIEALEEKIEYLSAMVAKLSEGEGAVDDIKEDVRETVKIIQGELHELEGKVSLLIRAASNPITGSYEVGNTKIPSRKLLGVLVMRKRLKVVPMYLTEDAKLWWRTKVEENISGQCSIASWDDFKRELKAQFYPENVAYNARCKLSDLQQTGSIREYVREFSTLMLNIKDMTGTDRLFNFLKGLKPWVKNELMRQNVKELKTALAIAESLDDYSTNTSKRKFDSSPSLDNRPKWGKFSSGGVNKDYSPFEGTKTRALVDTGATDNFIADRAALQFQLNMQEDTGKIKAVNSKATNIVGVARRVSCQMGPWNGEIDFTVIPLDDFDVVIGMEFLKKARAIPIPTVDCLY
ncbi:hypothetical protein GH714_035445 [Hevea brasiliensis]|uniref:Retrotransposon gag domain-containing protein n=1 Tax=Hevea brasiliensis TaxID=3981 RepID=A0A6A6L6Q5_HEVBR|nr:hypothetical protein GH714_035445 [Hevea brasiliensis]